jgi:hypothetical protein
VEDIFWRVTNPIFEIILWLLFSKDGPDYLPYIYFAFLIIMIYLLILSLRSTDE